MGEGEMLEERWISSPSLFLFFRLGEQESVLTIPRTAMARSTRRRRPVSRTGRRSRKPKGGVVAGSRRSARGGDGTKKPEDDAVLPAAMGGGSGLGKVKMFGVFHMTGCGACEAFMPEWNTPPFQKLAPNSRSFERQETTAAKEAFQRFGLSVPQVAAYPTIYKVVQTGHNTYKPMFFRGPARTPEAVGAWLRE